MFVHWSRMWRARPRTWGAFMAMIATVIALSPFVEWPTRLTLAWDVGVLLYLALVLRLAFTEDPEAIRRRAEREDDGAVLILAITCAAAAASLVAIAYEFATASHGDGQSTALRVCLAVGTIVLSWLMVQSTFAVHYAHEHYGKDAGEARGGLRFPCPGDGDYQPDYWDFFYFSANLGAAAQTSDVQVQSRKMRRIVLAHTLVGYLFNTLVVALGVNLAASVIGG